MSSGTRRKDARLEGKNLSSVLEPLKVAASSWSDE